MDSGQFRVQDVICNSCLCQLGWFYEYAFDRSQRFLEKKIVLEHAKIQRGVQRNKIENDCANDDYISYMLAFDGELLTHFIQSSQILSI